MPVYASLAALRAEDLSQFPVGFVAQVKREGKRKPDCYVLEEMTELGSSMRHLHWVYQHAPPKKSSHSSIDWGLYHSKRGW